MTPMTSPTQDQANPFAVQTPEDVSAELIVELFVDVFSDFFNIMHSGHTFLNGPRGSGKSMMFRYLEPDCQRIVTAQPFSALPFFGVYVPIKNLELKLTEFSRLTNRDAEFSLGEHLLVCFTAVRVFLSLTKVKLDDPDGSLAVLLTSYYNNQLRERLLWTGWNEPSIIAEGTSFKEALIQFQRLFTSFYLRASSYLKKLGFTKEQLPYDGPLLGYIDFLLPMLREIKRWPFLPDRPIYLLIDDADNLNDVQTKILNGWVSSRTSAFVSLKISTQLNYKTYLTATGQSITAPHDFNDVNISAVYTSEKDRYLNRVAAIVERRLKNGGITTIPRDFFPVYAKQEKAIAQIASSLRAQAPGDARGNRSRDDATRYARPNYMRGLAGSGKSGSTYRYAGFEQLVHLSSGVVRHFLESASSMFGEMRSFNSGSRVEYIDSAIQDKVVREEAQRFFFSELDQIELAETELKNVNAAGQVKRLRNLVFALGGMFRTILLSDSSERRVFSVALSDDNDEEVVGVLKLGVQLGYFHASSIGNKEGTGRTRLFVLSRRLAPFFQLDPTSFAGYRFMTTASLRLAMLHPKTFINRFESGQIDSMLKGVQIELFQGREVGE